ncbi:MAG TPA: LamG domain-containing protein [Kofleriaceae bacterium]|nr:LamG domain-containing protein [Kofleriaceae bacterium]
MRRDVLATILLASCTFDHGVAPTAAPDGGSAATGDAAVAPRACHSSDPGLVLCLDFEDPAQVIDSAAVPHQIEASGVQSVTRAGQLAAMLTPSSSIVISDQPALDIEMPLTMELWLMPGVPGDHGMYALDKPNEYDVWLDDTGAYCELYNASGHELYAGTFSPLAADAWTHLACVYDGSTLVLYRDGNVEACADGQRAIATSDHGTLQVSQQYAGGLDDLHLYAEALTADQVCALAGGKACKAGCPPNG